MFEQKALLYICTALESIEKIGIYTAAFKTYEALREANDQMNFNATCRLLLTIGEEVKKISEEIQTTQPQIDWHAITGLRNRMAHDYRGIDPSVVFDIVRHELGPLKEALKSFLKGYSIRRQDLDLILNSDHYKHIGYISGCIRIDRPEN